MWAHQAGFPQHWRDPELDPVGPGRGAVEPASRATGLGWVRMGPGWWRRVSSALLSSQRVLVVGNGTPLAALFAVSGFY